MEHLTKQELIQQLTQEKQKNLALEKKYQRNIRALETSSRLLKEKDESILSLQVFLEEVFYRAKLDGTLLEISPSIDTVSGYSPQELVGRNVLDFYENPVQRNLYISALKKSGSVRDFPIELIAKDGHIINFSMNSRIVYRGEKPSYIEGAMTDQTERFRLLRDLEKARDDALVASKAKSDFLAVISHELRTPIHGLMGMLGLLAEENLSKSQREYVSAAEHSVRALRYQVSNILDLCKVEAGMMVLHPQRFDLLLCVREVVHMLTFQAAEKELKFTVVWKHAPQFVVGDAVRLKQILLNLLDNAIKFTSSGFVCLSISQTTTSSQRLCFTIKDSGIGLSTAQQASVFEPFTQVDSSTTRLHAGTGLGTTIAQRLVNLMGGEIGVHSKLGEGSQFHFSLDMQSCEGEYIDDTWDVFHLTFDYKSPSKSSKPCLERFENKCILLADDDPISLKVIKKGFMRRGLNVMTAKDGLTALDMALRYHYDLILLDM
ncbi:MAG: ATP-binding protein, partial [Mariprofundaceae bacterium]|nr:ATP-binding protein [Mariprofundaceae bacterium]